MSKPILIVDPDAQYYRERLVADNPGLDIRAVPTRQAVAGQMSEVAAIFAFGNVFDKALVAGAPRLEWIQSLSSGTDRIVGLQTLRPEVVVTSTRGVHGPPVSEMAFLHMLVLARDYARILRNQMSALWENLPQPLLHGKTVAILGTGTIAADLARRCKAFGMTVVGISASPRQQKDFDRMFSRAEIECAAALADFLVALVPLSPETRGIIGTRVLQAMKPSAFVINLARGGVCDEDALLEALRERRIAGAGLDVFVTEPLPSDHPFWHERRVALTPHIAGVSDRYADLVIPILSENLRCFLESRRSDMINVVPH